MLTLKNPQSLTAECVQEGFSMDKAKQLNKSIDWYKTRLKSFVQTQGQCLGLLALTFQGPLLEKS